MLKLELIIKGFLGALKLKGKIEAYQHNSQNTNILAQYIPQIRDNGIEKPESFCSPFLDNILYSLNQEGFVQWAYGGNYKTSHYVFLNISKSDAAVQVGLSDIKLSHQLADAYIKANS